MIFKKPLNVNKYWVLWGFTTENHREYSEKDKTLNDQISRPNKKCKHFCCFFPYITNYMTFSVKNKKAFQSKVNRSLPEVKKFGHIPRQEPWLRGHGVPHVGRRPVTDQ